MDREVEALLASFFSKLAAGSLKLPPIPMPKPRQMGVGADAVGKLNPMKGTMGRPPQAPGVKAVTPPTAVNPAATAPMTRFTAAKAVR